MPSTDTLQPERRGDQPPVRLVAGFAPRLALTVVVGFAAVAGLVALVMLAVEPKPLPFGGFGKQRQDAETAVYVLTFAVLLPTATLIGPRLADRIATGPNGHALPLITASLAATFLITILLVRLSGRLPWGDGVDTLLGGIGLWAVGAAAVLRRAGWGPTWASVLAMANRARYVWVLSAALLIGAFLATTHLGTISPIALGLGIAAVALVLALVARQAIPRLRGVWGHAVDVVIVVLALLAVPDLVIFTPEAPSSAFDNYIIQFHHNYLLGPANQVLAGDAMLVDTASQYGVGTVDFLAGWFHLAPIGHGTYGFLDGVLTALSFVAGYAILRIAGALRLLAGCTLALAVVALAYNLVYSVGALPQQGPLRFGLPLALILFVVVGERWPRYSRLATAAALCVVGVSSIWALEAFGYTVAVYAAVMSFQAFLMAPGERLRYFGRRAMWAVGACVCAHVLFAVLTLIGAGELPDWGQYLAYLESFLFGELADFTYDVSRWSTGLVVGAGYFASAAAVILLVRGEPALVRRERLIVLALTGVSAYGIVLFSYFIQRSLVSVLPYVSLPALLAGALWLALLLRSGPAVPRSVRLGGVGLGLAIATLVFAASWSSIGGRFDRSALGHVLPGGASLSAAVERLWDPPPLDPRAPEGERLLNRYMPGESRSLILTEPDVGVEILMRTGRASRLPLANPGEDSYVPEERLPGLIEAVDQLRPGDRLLLSNATFDSLARIRSSPSYDPFSAVLTDVARLAPLQEWALARIDERFRLKLRHRGDDGFFVASLEPR